MNNRYKDLSHDILKVGFYLEHLGIFEYAWKKDDIMQIVKILREKNISVIGGDVYRITDDRIETTYDGWYINNDGDSDFVKRSLDKVISYIENYENINGDNFIYTLVF